MASPFQTFTPTQERPQIGEAISIIITRMRAGYLTTAIIFPPRFGKSDVIRAGALELAAVFNAVCVVLSPWVFLREQVISPSKCKAMYDRLAISQGLYCDVLGTVQFMGDFYKARPLRSLWSSTIQAGRQRENIIALKDAVGMLAREGRPLVVFIDESHMIAIGIAGWAALASELQSAGAHIVLLTGSPYRSDNIAPFGFEVTELKRSPITYHVPSFDNIGNPVMKEFSAEKVTYKLKADLEVSRETAWSIGALTKINARWFDFTVDGVNIANITDVGDARKALASGVRDPAVIERAAIVMVEDVYVRRRTMPGSAAIIYVGNDRGDETADSSHTAEVTRIVRRVWAKRFGSPPKITIAMLKESETNSETEAKKIEAFVGTDDIPGIGDVLIVKQMGGVGLDAPRIKTGLDLSPIRTLVAVIQRWLRVATPDEDGGTATLVLPKDKITESFYKHVVIDQGGDYDSTLENQRLIGLTDRDPNDPPEPLIIADPGVAGTTDSNWVSIDALTDDAVDKFLRQRPELIKLYTRPEIATLLASGQFKIMPEEDEDEEDEEDEEDFDISADLLAGSDIPTVVAELRKEIAELTGKIANNKYSYAVQRKEWVTYRRYLYGSVKTYADIRGPLQRCRDVPRLEGARDYLRTMLNR